MVSEGIAVVLDLFDALRLLGQMLAVGQHRTKLGCAPAQIF
jgi:hypothetical protein